MNIKIFFKAVISTNLCEIFQITDIDIILIDKQIKKMLRHKIPFERIEVSKANLLELFSYNKYKRQIIEEKINERGTVYRCGNLIDLCSGPHVKHTGAIKSFKILDVRESFYYI